MTERLKPKITLTEQDFADRPPQVDNVVLPEKLPKVKLDLRPLGLSALLRIHRKREAMGLGRAKKD